MKPQVTITVFSSTHVFRGSVAAAERVADVLADDMSDYLDVVDVEVSRLSTDDQPIATLTHATIRKDKIVLVLIDVEAHEAPTQRHVKRSQKVGRSAYVAIDGFEVAGTAHLALHSSADKHTLSTDLKTFFPLTDAIVSCADSTRPTVKAGVALVNKDHLALFHLARL